MTTTKQHPKSFDKEEDGEYDQKSIITILLDAALLPARLIISRPFLRAYLSLFLFAALAIALLLLSATTYIVFYNAYIPYQGFEKTIHLQFPQDDFTSQLLPQSGHSVSSPLPVVSLHSTHRHPYGIISLDPSTGPFLHANQPYDISITLQLPRTPQNIAAGNFMLDLQLLSASSSTDPKITARTPPLAHSRRPASLTYASPLLENVYKAALLPLYVIGWRQEAETVEVSMMEGVEFKKGKGKSGVPREVRVEIASREVLQVYWIKVGFTAKLGGLRYWMRTYRIRSFVIFTAIFWITSMTFAVSIWGLSAYIQRRRHLKKESNAAIESGASDASNDAKKNIKSDPNIKREHDNEEDDDDGDTTTHGEDTLSDTPRSFPTFSRQPPLRYSAALSASRGVKLDPSIAEVESDMPEFPSIIDENIAEQDLVYEDALHNVPGPGPRQPPPSGRPTFTDTGIPIPQQDPAADADAEEDFEEEDEDADFVGVGVSGGGASGRLKKWIPEGARSDSGLGTSVEGSNAGDVNATVRQRRSGGAGAGAVGDFGRDVE